PVDEDFDGFLQVPDVGQRHPLEEVVRGDAGVELPAQRAWPLGRLFLLLVRHGRGLLREPPRFSHANTTCFVLCQSPPARSARPPRLPRRTWGAAIVNGRPSPQQRASCLEYLPLALLGNPVGRSADVTAAAALLDAIRENPEDDTPRLV